VDLAGQVVDLPGQRGIRRHFLGELCPDILDVLFLIGDRRQGQLQVAL
jgi:hypothetical protein